MSRDKFAVGNCLKKEDIRTARKKLNLTQRDFAELVNVSLKTIERWETEEKDITGPIVTLLRILKEAPDMVEKLKIPPREYPMRLWYMYRQEVCTIIDVDEFRKSVKVYNYTDHVMFCAFGKEKNPTFEQYEEFLESRCFPKSRDKMKLILKDLDLPFYDPLLIIEKTEGKMQEDEFWIRIER